jgi:hypothetical protein
MERRLVYLPGFGVRQSSGAFGRRLIYRAGQKAAEDCRSPRRFAFAEAIGCSARFWSAPALWRFWKVFDLPRWSKSGRGLPQSKTLRAFLGARLFRQALDCGSPLPLSHGASPLRRHLKIIRHLQLVRLEPVNRLHHRLRSRPLEPSCRAPWVLIRHRHQPMPHGFW